MHHISGRAGARRRLSRSRSIAAVTIAVGSVSTFLVREAHADRYWINSVTAGNWNTAADWNATAANGAGGAGVPGSADRVFLTNIGGGSAYDITLNTSTTISALTVSYAGTGSEELDILTGASMVNTGGVVVGSAANQSGIIFQNGGGNTVGGSLLVAGGGTGLYTLGSSAILNVTQSEYIGDGGGTGQFNQSGSSANDLGSTASPQSLYVGAFSTGSYTLGGSAVLNDWGSEYVGFSGGTGDAFNQSGGTNSVLSTNSGLSSLFVGQSPTPGTYLLSAGTLSVSGNENIGSLGVGTFNQSGSGVNTATNLYVGTQSGGAGTFILSGGSLTLSNAGFVGYQSGGAGTFNQSGSTSFASFGSLTVGLGVSTSGNYLLSGGTLSVSGIESVGSFNGGSGTVTLSSTGQNIVSGELDVGLNSSTGTYIINGGTLSAATENIGYGGAGTIIQSNGTNLSSFMQVGENNNGSIGTGTYRLSGGTFTNTGGVFIGTLANGTFNQSGGLATIGTVASPALLLMGNVGAGTYLLSSTGSLVVNGTELVGIGPGTFSQSGGANTIGSASAAGTLSVGGGTYAGALYTGAGTYLLSSGTLITNGTEYVGNGTTSTGLFNESGGTNTIGSATNNQSLIIGNAGGVGTYLLSGSGFNGWLNINGSLQVGGSGTGTFNQSSGTTYLLPANGGAALFVGQGGAGTCIFGGDGFNVAGDAVIGVGPGGAGTLIQNGGSLTIYNGGHLYVGQGGAGTLMLNNGSIGAAAGEVIGYGAGAVVGTGNVVQIAGINNSGTLGISYGIDTGTYTLNGGTLNVASLCYLNVGDSGPGGTLSQNGGVCNVGSSSGGGGILNVGFFSPGTYSLTAGSLTVYSGEEEVGYSGAGTFNQSGGFNNVGNGGFGIFVLGDHSTGTYVLGGGTLLVSFEELIGQAGGSGTFIQSAGNNTFSNVGGSGYLPVGNGGAGTYLLSGTGSLNVAAPLIIGDNSSGYFNQSGLSSVTIGSAATQQNLCVGGGILSGSFVAGTGTYVLGNGALTVNGTAYIGAGTNNSVGMFSQSGSLSSVTIGAGSSPQSLYVGGSTTGGAGTGSYVLSAGSLNMFGSEYIGTGTNSAGTFIQSGGINSFGGGTLVTQNLQIGKNGGVGTYLLSGGTLSLFGNITVGSGNLTVSGGSAVMGGSISIAAAGAASLNLSNSGQISTASLNLNGGSQNFNWTGGTLAIGSNVTIGPGSGLGSALTVSATATLITSGSLANGGQLQLIGGTVNSSQAVVNNGLINGNGTIQASGGFTNNNSIYQSNGNLSFPGTVAVVNNNLISLANGYQLILNPAGLTNPGQVNLGGAAITETTTPAAGTFTNSSSGIVYGPGQMQVPFINQGGFYIPQGLTTVSSAFSNFGIIDLLASGATLGGGTITNLITIEGAGQITAPVTNSGHITPLGGQLIFTQPLTNTSAAASVQVSSGNSLLALAGLTNSGFINLTGGGIDSSYNSIINSGTITGRGTINGLFLVNSGKLAFSAGTTDIYAQVTNSGRIAVTGGNTSTFYNAVALTSGGTGSLTVDSGSTAVFFGSVTGQSAITGAGTVDFESNSVGGAIVAPTGSAIVGGSAVVVADSIHENNLNISGTTQVSHNGTPSGTSVVNHLTLSGGTLNLTDNGIVILDTTELASVKAAIKQAYDNHLWDQPGITSSTAAADPNNHAIGYALASTLPNGGSTSYNGVTFSDAVIARYTLIGDTSLKGTVDLSDYTKVVLNLGKSNANWSDGNFDYSGNVNLGDYTKVVLNIGRSDGTSTVFNSTGPTSQQVKASALTLKTAPAVAPVVNATDVSLLVNPTNGRVTLISALQTGQAVITAYAISSRSGSLLPFSTDSNGKYLGAALQNNPQVFYQASNGLTYNLWTSIKNVSTYIGEGFSQHYSPTNDSTWTNYTLSTSGYGLGTLFKRLSSGGTRDLTFQWDDANLNTYTGVVTYVPVLLPEPTSVSLFAIGALAMLGRRRRSNPMTSRERRTALL